MRQQPVLRVRAGRAGVEPVHARVPAKPGFLAAGETAGRLDRLQPGLLGRALAVQVAQQLLVAQRAAGCPALAQALADQCPHLVGQARLPHAVDPVGDPLVQFGPGQRETDLDGRAHLPVLRHGGGERPPGQLEHLQGTDDPAAVAGQDGRGRGLVERGQPGVQSRRADLAELGLQARTDTCVRSGKVQVVQGRADVQTRAADQHRYPAAGGDVVDRGAGQLGVVGHVRGLGHRPDVEQVVRDATAGGLGFLGRADIHALVELHRVGVDDLAAQGAGQLQAQPGLAGGRRAHHGDRVRAHGVQVCPHLGPRRCQEATK